MPLLGGGRLLRRVRGRRLTLPALLILTFLGLVLTPQPRLLLLRLEASLPRLVFLVARPARRCGLCFLFLLLLEFLRLL